MTDTDKLLKAILVELRAIRTVIAPDKTVKPKSEVSVSTVNVTDGVRRESGDDGDVPRQLETDYVEAGPMRRSRPVTRFRDPRGE